MRGFRCFRHVCVCGEGCVQVHLALKSSDNVFYLFVLVLNLFCRSPVVTFKENYHCPRFQWWWNIFQGGPTFSRGVQLLFPYRNLYNLWFSKEVWTPCPHPLDPPMWFRISWFNLSTRFSLFFFNITFANSFVETGGNVASAAVLPVVVVIKY